MGRYKLNEIVCLLAAQACCFCLFFCIQIKNVSAFDETNAVWSWTDNSGLRRTREDLREILKQHKLWLESGGKAGVRASLQGADLTFGNAEQGHLLGPELRRANLR